MSSEKISLDELRIDRSQGSRRGPLGAIVLIVALLIAATGGGYFWLNMPGAVPVRTAVVVETVSGESGGSTLLNSSGYVTARREATVSSKVTGKVIEVNVEEGMKVEEGQVLSRIDASNVERSLELAKAQVVSASEALNETRANLDLAERDLRRAIDLTSQEVMTESELDRAKANVNSLQARLERQEADVGVAQREVELWEQQLDDTIIRAPFAGIVTAKNAQPGEMISLMSAGGGFTRTGICTIVDMSSLEIEVDVSESYINRVAAGQPVTATLDSYPDWKIPAKVIAIIPTADRQKATVKVRVGFDALDPRILPDMSVKVAFLSNEESETVTRSLWVPKSAIFEREGKNIVFVVRDGIVERRAVTLGAENGDNVAIAAGVASGESVVVEGPDTLADGVRVTEAKA
ncbi:MAG TPA: efflux RND transporter periplasmic adaptor subunit [Candidatus Hydrogenedentes bacterium]|nr:efflux RND transporter periplasmic adaptor subunit [Candidatus Hydrogenedentota bacterium]HRK33066.1 efflux RND transporter periplasmic adaptor subunit [Candidatus Hydrogenedentota bacterium]